MAGAETVWAAAWWKIRQGRKQVGGDKKTAGTVAFSVVSRVANTSHYVGKGTFLRKEAKVKF